MSTPEQHVEVVVGDDGSVSVHLSAQDVARLGARPGDHLRLLRNDTPSGRARKKVRGVLVGKIPPDEVLMWEDFEAAHRASVEAAEHRYGVLE